MADVSAPPLPGDLSGAALVARMLRVDHAGELGAARIYEGQLAVLGATRHGAAIREMAAQERRHLETFERLVARHRVRPTALAPLWRAAGFALGAAAALAGPRAAMACTVAIETEIEAHYARQIERLRAEPETDAQAGEDGPLSDTLAAFRGDELAHRDAGRAAGAEDSPAAAPIAALIRLGCRAAIGLSERV